MFMWDILLIDRQKQKKMIKECFGFYKKPLNLCKRKAHNGVISVASSKHQTCCYDQMYFLSENQWVLFSFPSQLINGFFISQRLGGSLIFTPLLSLVWTSLNPEGNHFHMLLGESFDPYLLMFWMQCQEKKMLHTQISIAAVKMFLLQIF